MSLRLLSVLVALGLAAALGPGLDPDVLDARGRSGRYYEKIDLRGWSAQGALVYEGQASGDDLDCGSSLSWRTRLLVFRGAAGADRFRIGADGHQEFATRPIQGSLQETRARAGCSTEDPAVREYDAAGAAEEGAVRLAKAGSLSPVCRVEEARGKCASPDGASALEIDRTAGKPDKRGCRSERLRYMLRKADGSQAELRAFSAQTCAREDLTFQVSWAADSRKVAAATNAVVRGRSATAMESFARLDVFDVAAASSPR